MSNNFTDIITQAIQSFYPGSSVEEVLTPQIEEKPPVVELEDGPVTHVTESKAYKRYLDFTRSRLNYDPISNTDSVSMSEVPSSAYYDADEYDFVDGSDYEI